MFGIDSPELLVIAIVALVVIGPKELPGLLRTWGRWMAQMRGMASEFRGHVDEMIRQTELDDVKKQLTGASEGLDLKSLDPTQQIRQHVQEGIDEGEKAFNEAKTSFDNPLAEPESAPQIAAEPAAETTATETTATETAVETTAVAEATPSETAAPETASPVSEAPQTEEKPVKAAAE